MIWLCYASLMAPRRHDPTALKAGRLAEAKPLSPVEEVGATALEIVLGEPAASDWSDVAAADLLEALASLEADVPEDELAEWLAAFHSM